MVDERMDTVEKLLALQQQSLDYHIKRTDLAEQSLQVLKNELMEIKTIEIKFTSNLKFIGRVCAYIGGFSAFVLVLIQIKQALL